MVRSSSDTPLPSLSALVRDDRGATAVEYALILAAIAAVIILVVVAMGIKVKDLFELANTDW